VLGFAVLATTAWDVVSDAGSALPLDLRKAAAWEWRCRHHFERDAMARFARLSESLQSEGANEQVVAMACKAAKDEERHAELCCDLVRYLGAVAPENVAAAGAKVAPPGLSAREQLLYEVVAMSCVTETLSCALLGGLIELAKDQHIKEVMQSILRDEIGHSRLGWAYLADRATHGPQNFISDHLPAMLAGTVSDELFDEREAHPMEEALNGLGALSRKERLSIFDESMNAIVFPGLERFNVDTSHGRRWLEAQQKESVVSP
jgi:hypothetical protein